MSPRAGLRELFVGVSDDQFDVVPSERFGLFGFAAFGGGLAVDAAHEPADFGMLGRVVARVVSVMMGDGGEVGAQSVGLLPLLRQGGQPDLKIAGRGEEFRPVPDN